MKKTGTGGCPKRKKEIAYRAMADELVFLDLESGIYYSSNEMGKIIWEMCDGKTPPDEIAQKISGDFDVKEEEALQDVQEFINDLVSEGLLILENDKNKLQA